MNETTTGDEPKGAVATDALGNAPGDTGGDEAAHGAPDGREATATTEPATHQSAGPGSGQLVALVLGITAVVGLMLLAFALPGLNSGAKNLPLAVSGPAPLVEQITTMMETAQPGAFDVTTHATPEESAEAILDRDAVGGIAVGPEGVTIQLASGAGAPYSSILRGIGTQLEATGQQVTYEDLAPFPEEDPSGAGLTTLALPLIFGGMASAAALVLGYKGPVRARIAAALGIAVLAGFVATAILEFGFGVLEGDYLLMSLSVAAGIASISLVVLGLGLLLGPPGIGLGAVLMLFVSNPLSGMAAGPWFLPQPWGAIGQFLPLGASNTAMRSAAYFDGAGSEQAWIVLGCWILVGILIASVAARRRVVQRAAA